MNAEQLYFDLVIGHLKKLIKVCYQKTPSNFIKKLINKILLLVKWILMTLLE